MDSPFIYQYIANSNPELSAALCNKYGYSCNNIDDVVGAFYDITNRYGEQALKEITDLHPDKELVLELHSKPLGNCAKCPALNRMLETTFTGANGQITTGAPAVNNSSTNQNQQSNNNWQPLFSTIENNKMMVFTVCLTLVAITVIITTQKQK